MKNQQLNGQILCEIEHSLRMHLTVQLGSKIKDQLISNFHNDIGNQLYKQYSVLENYLWNQLRKSIKVNQ